MPTVYTAWIEDGTIKTAQEFLMLCAREFCACASMLGEPLSKQIPEKFDPDYKWYAEQLEKERKRLERLRKMSLDEVRIYREEKRKEEISDAERAKECEEKILSKYKDVLSQVAAWNPPTPEHNRLKEFAIGQITMCLPDLSIYTEKPNSVTDEQWIKDNIESCKESIARYKEKIEAEIERAKSRTAWVKALRDSFTEQEEN